MRLSHRSLAKLILGSRYCFDTLPLPQLEPLITGQPQALNLNLNIRGIRTLRILPPNSNTLHGTHAPPFPHSHYPALIYNRSLTWSDMHTLVHAKNRKVYVPPLDTSLEYQFNSQVPALNNQLDVCSNMCTVSFEVQLCTVPAASLQVQTAPKNNLQ